MKKLIPLIFVLIFNLWIWKIFSFSFLIGTLTVLASLSLYLSLQTNKKKYLYILILLFVFLLFFQYKTSSKNSLTFLNDNEKLQQQIRLRGYPPSRIPIANWLENRKETLIFYKLEANISEVVDPNLYFFANHPRERVGVVEYEKFAYILIPFFILGLFSIKKKNIKTLLISISPFVLISVIGNSNPVGPFSLFPFLSSFTGIGLIPVFSKRKYLIPFLIIFALVFIQTLAYAKY